MIRRRRKDIDLEVLHDADRDAWVVRQFGGDPKKDPYAVKDTRALAEEVAAGIATFTAMEVNRRSCQVRVRELDGTFGDPSTYGWDPEASRG